ncbi:hypothetical protein QAD02_006929 [Eretmocerus hayati]|uniref:Uncharacterized protein n=1 Tax=Eretmocerus hayati TaxID=131215 RepID=A0ACC2N2A1_9HYME|nr:hypothetical protein QAD02_006929 [Eretmocerus hayati]
MWTPADHTLYCSQHPAVTTCQPNFLAFMALVVNHLGQSLDGQRTADEGVTQNIQGAGHDQYDFIIVGADTAGCVLASRLSEIEDWKILLLESGDEEPQVAEVPGFRSMLKYSSVEQLYKTEPEPILNDKQDRRSDLWSHGRVMGGDSILTSDWHSYGHEQDIDAWEEAGNTGWKYKDLLPYFRRLGDSNNQANTAGNFEYPDRNSRIILGGWRELGFKETNASSISTQVGISKSRSSVVNGVYKSANSIYIRPIREKRKNLTIKTKSQVLKIIIDQSSKRAMGVEYFDFSSQTLKRAMVNKEVLVAGGAVESPKLLMVSGVGPADHLQEANIPLVQDLAVGNNLHDHPMVFSEIFNLDPKVSTFTNVANMQEDLINWMKNRGGPLSTLGISSFATYYQTPSEKLQGTPDIEFQFSGFVSALPDDSRIPTPYYDAVKLSTTLLNPKSRGLIRLNLNNPMDQPLIHPNYLEDVEDTRILSKGIFMGRKIAKTRALRQNGFGHSKKPVPGCEDFPYESEEYAICLLKRYVTSASRPGGTCKMGPISDTSAVVDPSLKVYGVAGLRVVGPEIMPTPVRGDSYPISVAIAEKAADMIKEDLLTQQQRRDYSRHRSPWQNWLTTVGSRALMLVRIY